MTPRQKVLFSGQQLENIFSNNRFLLLTQFPFENAEQFVRLNQKLADLGFMCKKLSRTDLAKQLHSSKASFISCSNSNYIITETDGQEISSKVSELAPIFFLVQENGGVLFFFRLADHFSAFEVWHDYLRLTENNTLPKQPPFSFHLNKIIKSQSVLPLLSSSNVELINLLTFSRNKTKATQ